METGTALFLASGYIATYLRLSGKPVIYAYSEKLATSTEGRKKVSEAYGASDVHDKEWLTDVNSKLLSRWQNVPATDPKLVVGRIEGIIKQVPTLARKYWPSIFWLGNLQLIPFMANGIYYKSKGRRLFDWAYEDAALKDGESVRIAYAGSPDLPARTEDHSVVVIMHHGAGGRENDLPGTQYVGRALEQGWKVISLVRRGHVSRLTKPKFNFFGNTDETRYLIETYVKKRYPNSTLLFIGISAGSGLIARYMGEQGVTIKKAHAAAAAAKNSPSRPYSDFSHSTPAYVSGALGISAGYNIETCMGRFMEPFQTILLWAQKKLYLAKNKKLLQDAYPDDYEACAAAKGVQEWNDRTFRFAGYSSRDEYYDNTNPMRVAHEIVDPCLFVNSLDDPICPIENLYEHLDMFDRPNCIAVAETATGSHCPFTPLSWNPFTTKAMTEDVMVEFFTAILKDKGVSVGGTVLPLQ